MEEKKVKRTCKQKMLFYTTAFFVLLGIFSVFSFLFLVPFVIDPAFTTIFLEFDENPASCVTISVAKRRGTTNCTWSSCREGCTKELYNCTQIRVKYKRHVPELNAIVATSLPLPMPASTRRRKRGLLADADDDDFDYVHRFGAVRETDDDDADDVDDADLLDAQPTGLMGNDSEWYYRGAKLLPNVKGCGYPPMLNCTTFIKQYIEIGTNFTCFYSRVDPGIVISSLDMRQVHMNLVYAMAIPIPSFIVSVIYLTFAYFKIYNDDEEKAPLKSNAESIEGEAESERAGESPLPPASGAITPASEAFREDLASFGHQFKVAMADDMTISRESFTTEVVIGTSNSQGNLGIMMTTSISTTEGPIADI